MRAYYKYKKSLRINKLKMLIVVNESPSNEYFNLYIFNYFFIKKYCYLKVCFDIMLKVKDFFETKTLNIFILHFTVLWLCEKTGDSVRNSRAWTDAKFAYPGSNIGFQIRQLLSLSLQFLVLGLPRIHSSFKKTLSPSLLQQPSLPPH